MNKKTFLFIFAGAAAAGLVCLIAGLIVFYTVKDNAVATVVSLFAIIAGAIMAIIGVITLLIIALTIILAKRKPDKSDEENAEGGGKTDGRR